MKNILILTDGYINYTIINSIIFDKKNKVFILPLRDRDIFKLHDFKEHIIDEKLYFNNNTHSKVLQISNTVKNLINEILTIQLNSIKVKSINIWFSNFFIKNFLNYKLKIIFSLNNIFNLYNFDDVIYFNANSKYDNIDLINILLNSFNQKFSIYKKKIKIKKKINFQFPINLFKFYNSLINLNNNIVITSKNYNCYEIAKNSLNTSSNLIVLSDTINFIDIFKNIINGNLKTFFLLSSKIKNFTHKINYNLFISKFPLKKDPKLIRYFQKNLESIYNDNLIQILQKCEYLVHSFRKSIPKVFFSTDSNYINGFIGEFANFKKIPSYCITHGTHTAPKNKYEEIYQKDIAESVILNQYKFIVSQSTFCDEFLKHYQTESKIIKTKPLVYSYLNTAPPYNRTLLHASTTKTEVSQKFWGVETINEYLQSISDIGDVAYDLKFNLIVKPHPSFSKIIDIKYLKKYFSNKNIVFTDDSFKNCLKKSDILISYSSTTIEESLYNRRPVILYDRNNRYNHLDAQMISNNFFSKKKPYFYFTNKINLEKYINIIYQTHYENQFNYDLIFKNHYKNLKI